MSKIKALVATAFVSAICVQAQNAPNVSQVLMWSTVTGNLSLTPAPNVFVVFSANISARYLDTLVPARSNDPESKSAIAEN